MNSSRILTRRNLSGDVAICLVAINAAASPFLPNVSSQPRQLNSGMNSCVIFILTRYHFELYTQRCAVRTSSTTVLIPNHLLAS
jgi:hypothetical protein